MNQITVVMALYKPNLKWLQEELESIEKQTYRKFEILAWNDCPEDIYDYNSFFRKCMPSIPFQLFQGQENMGSNGVFATLTAKVKTPFIAYCDQDDIWEADKLEVLLHIIEEKDAALVCSDMKVIDGDSKVTASCIAQVRPRHIFYPGPHALEHLLAKNFVTGCTMLMKTAVAQDALPFPKSVFHDWWLAVYAAIVGNVVMTDKPLMRYRIYGGNQSAVLKGVIDKESYFRQRILPQYEFIQNVAKRFPSNFQVEKALQWASARKCYFEHANLKDARVILSERKNNKWTTCLELLLPLMPEFMFAKILRREKERAFVIRRYWKAEVPASFSLIVATYGREKEVDLFLDSIQKQRYDLNRIEVILVDQNDEIDLAPIVNKHKSVLHIKHIHSTRKGTSYNRNLGIKNASGEIIAFPDDDCMYYEDTLQNVCLSFMRFDSADCLLGRIYARREKENRIRPWKRKSFKINWWNFFRNYSEIVMFIRKNAVDFFSEDFGPNAKWGSCEGVDFVANLLTKGENIWYTPGFDVWHPKQNIQEFSLSKARFYGLGFGAFCRKHVNFPILLLLFEALIYHFLYGILALLKGNLAGAKNRCACVVSRIEGFFNFT